MEIYRYFTYEKLYRLLNDKTLWFSNTGEFLDKKERQLPRGLCDYFPSHESKEKYMNIAEFKKRYCQSYVSCWTKAKDSYALWKIYTPSGNGCMLATTIGKMKAQLSDMVALFNVEYIDELVEGSAAHVWFSANDMPSSIGAYEKYKITSYKYEEEVRFVFYSNRYEKGYAEPVDISKVFDYAIISPFATVDETEKIKKILKASLPDIDIRNSIISEN